MYNKRTWLNTEKSPSCGSVIAFDGETTYKGKAYRNTFLAVSDCCVSARLHKTDDDSITDFINKMELLKNEIGEFIEYLKDNS